MTDPDDDLPALRGPATGRRSDDAFARSVAADVSAARKRWSPLWLGLPSLAVDQHRQDLFVPEHVVVLVGGPSLRAPRGPDARAVYAAAVDAGDDAGDDVGIFDDDDDVLAFAADDGEDDDFAIPGLAGSSDRELADIEAALDRALKL